MKFIVITFFSLIASYLFALDTGFLGDDILRIVIQNNEFASLQTALNSELADRPFLLLLIWIENLVFGLNPACFRIINILFHALASWQLFKLIQEISPEKTQNKKQIAALFAFLFALHPLHNQTIMIAIQTSIAVAGLFGIISIRYFFMFMHLGKKKSLVVSTLALTLAILAKPIVSFLPIFYFIVWAYLFRVKGKYAFFIIPYVSTLLIPIFYYTYLNKNSQKLAYSAVSYFLIQSEVLFTYFKLMILPYGLKYLYDFNPPDDLLWNINWLFVLLHLVIIFFSLRLLKEKIQRLLVIGFYLSFTPESSFFAIKHLAWEHRTYFPMIFLTLLISNISFFNNIKIRSMRIASLIFIPAYLMLNQIRNFQIKPSYNWMYHTMENSESHHEFNVSFMGTLIDLNLPHTDLQVIIDKYSKYPKATYYQVLIAAHEFTKKPTQEKLQSLVEITKSPIKDTGARVWLNLFIIREVEKSGATNLGKLSLEKMLSGQMTIFFKSPKDFKRLISMYEKLAKFLIINDGKNDLQLDKVESMRIRAILTYYYEETYPGLEKEIQKALLKDSKSYTLQRLLQLIHFRK